MTEEARKLLEKARRALRAAECLKKDGNEEFAAGRAYYAMFHAAQALLREKNLQYRKHASVHAAFGEHFAKPGCWTLNTTGGC
ncbi:MAG TPA: HEPN domain-containing protein [Bryobacteraceae bacterium]|nr:HEPN domain-containing protein [Bryobacteraceae bacterium]